MRGVRPTWAEIDLAALQANYRAIRSQLRDGVQLMAVLKADAYGHGAVPCARALESIGADWFGVALPEEGRALRQAGMTRPIFCVGGFWQGQGEQIVADRIVPAIFRRDALEELDAQARAAGQIVEYHLKVDTGMGRLGILEADLADWIEILPAYPHARLTGLLTHFADADGEDPGTTRQVQKPWTLGASGRASHRPACTLIRTGDDATTGAPRMDTRTSNSESEAADPP